MKYRNKRKRKYRVTTTIHYKPSNKVKDRAKKFRISLVLAQTEAEKIFKDILKELNINFKFQFILFYPYSFYILDFYLPKYKIAFEIDGNQHYTEKGIKKDKIRTKNIEQYGVNVVRFKNSEVFDIENTKGLVKELLDI